MCGGMSGGCGRLGRCEGWFVTPQILGNVELDLWLQVKGYNRKGYFYPS